MITDFVDCITCNGQTLPSVSPAGECPWCVASRLDAEVEPLLAYFDLLASRDEYEQALTYAVPIGAAA